MLRAPSRPIATPGAFVLNPALPGELGRSARTLRGVGLAGQVEALVAGQSRVFRSAQWQIGTAGGSMP